MSGVDLIRPPSDLPSGASLFVDFDGTLVELVDHPEAVVVDKGLADLLADLAAKFGRRIAIVSGRSIAQLDVLLGDAAHALTLVGSHGAERRGPDGRVEAPRPPAGLDRADVALSAFAARHIGAVVERKSFGVALHYRQVPELEQDALDFAHQLARDAGLEPQPGKLMVDLKLPGESKGAALSRMLQKPCLRKSLPWFVGDDLTDESGFAAARASGGHGVLVGKRRPTAASFALPDVDAVRGWLRQVLKNRR